MRAIATYRASANTQKRLIRIAYNRMRHEKQWTVFTIDLVCMSNQHQESHQTGSRLSSIARFPVSARLANAWTTDTHLNRYSQSIASRHSRHSENTIPRTSANYWVDWTMPYPLIASSVDQWLELWTISVIWWPFRTIVRFNPNNFEWDRSTPIARVLWILNSYSFPQWGWLCRILESHMNIINRVSTSLLDDTRDIPFLNDGQQMIATSFFTTIVSCISIDRSVRCRYSNGLLRINDALFHLASYRDHAVYTYSHWSSFAVLNASKRFSSQSS